MCESCWEEHGSPAIWNPQIERAVSLIGTIYETEPSGGALHVVLDDWNLTGDIRVADVDDYEMEPAAVAAIQELAALLNEMTIDERASALARAHGFIPTGAAP